MLLFVCDRCKFTSPGAEALCQTCGAKVRKEMPVREVLYRMESTQSHSLLTNAWDAVEQIWHQLAIALKNRSPQAGSTELNTGDDKFGKSIHAKLPPEGFARP